MNFGELMSLCEILLGCRIEAHIVHEPEDNTYTWTVDTSVSPEIPISGTEISLREACGNMCQALHDLINCMLGISQIGKTIIVPDGKMTQNKLDRQTIFVYFGANNEVHLVLDESKRVLWQSDANERKD